MALNPWEALPDRQLVAQTRHGRPDAFGELVRRYQGAVHNTAYRLTGNQQEAQDIAQDAFVRAYHALATYDPDRPFGPWIGRIATNAALASLGRRRLPTLPLDQLFDAAGETREGATHEPPSADDSPEQGYLLAERGEALRRAILALPPHFRAVIELRHYHDCSYEEIATTLALPLSDVKSHLFRARRLLRAALVGEDWR